MTTLATAVTVLKRSKDDAVRRVENSVSPNDIGGSIFAAAEFAKGKLEGLSYDVPWHIAGKIGYSRTPETRKKFPDNYHDQVMEEVKSVVGAWQSYAVCATIDAIIADLESR